MFDQLFFQRILVDDGDGRARVSGSTIASPFGAFLSDELVTPGKVGTGAHAREAHRTRPPIRLLVDLEASWRSSEPRTFVSSLAQGSKDDVMAEREGFEPSVDVEAHTRFPVVPVQPLRHLSGAGRVSAPSAQVRSTRRLCAAPALARRAMSGRRRRPPVSRS